MVGNIPKVMGKRYEEGRRRSVSVWMIVAASVIVLAAGTLGFDAYTGKIGILTPHFETVQNGAGRIIKVPPGGNVQSAIVASSMVSATCCNCLPVLPLA